MHMNCIEKLPAVNIKEKAQEMVIMDIKGHSIKHQDLNKTKQKGDLNSIDQIEKAEEI